MRQFILRQNILRFQKLLEQEEKAELRHVLRGMLASARRELAVLDAAVVGVSIGPAPRMSARRPLIEFRDVFEAPDAGRMLLDVRAGLRIVDVNDVYAANTLIDRAKVAGQPLFEVFPDNPDDPEADGVHNLFASLEWAAKHGKPHTMAVQRYDVRDNEGNWVERYWAPKNTPIIDDDGRIIYIVHTAEDVTDEVLARIARSASG